MLKVQSWQSNRPAQESVGFLRYLCLLCLCAVAFLPGISSLPPTDRDEARFVQSTRQMVETGNFVDIRLQDVPRYKKPAGIYWLQSAAVIASGRGGEAPIWVYRTVSVMGATLAVLATAWIGAWLFGSGAGLIAGVGLAGALMLGLEARIAKTDAMLLASAVIAQAALARAYIAHKHGLKASTGAAYLFWAAQGAAILIKGPLVPLLSLLTVGGVVVFDRGLAWLRDLRPVGGVILATLISVPWLVLITLESDGQFLRDSLGVDAFGKVTAGQESHGAPPGLYFLTFPLFLWPFGFLLFASLLKAFVHLRDDPRILFCCAWILLFYLVFELIPTKLPHYTLPIFPALFLLYAWKDSDPSSGAVVHRRWQTWLHHLARFGTAVSTMLLAAFLLAVTPFVAGAFSVWGAIAAVLALATGALGIGLPVRLEHGRRTIVMALGAAAVYATMTIQILPNLDVIWISPRVVDAIETHKRCDKPRLVSAGFHEPSLVFLAGTDTLLTDGTGAARELSGGTDCELALVDEEQRRLFLDETTRSGTDAEAVAVIEGINYSKGKSLTLTLFRRAR